VVIETVFAWPGLGLMAVEAINRRDYAVVQGVLLLAVTTVLLMNLVVDMLYATVDPRVRVE
jgi:peptide/nickel transport system permease protein